jgi:hypothetical protein
MAAKRGIRERVVFDLPWPAASRHDGIISF